MSTLNYNLIKNKSEENIISINDLEKLHQDFLITKLQLLYLSLRRKIICLDHIAQNQKNYKSFLLYFNYDDIKHKFTFINDRYTQLIIINNFKKILSQDKLIEISDIQYLYDQASCELQTFLLPILYFIKSSDKFYKKKKYIKQLETYFYNFINDSNIILDCRYHIKININNIIPSGISSWRFLEYNTELTILDDPIINFSVLNNISIDQLEKFFNQSILVDEEDYFTTFNINNKPSITTFYYQLQNENINFKFKHIPKNCTIVKKKIRKEINIQQHILYPNISNINQWLRKYNIYNKHKFTNQYIIDYLFNKLNIKNRNYISESMLDSFRIFAFQNSSY